jgi:hypothetical protein
MPKHIPEERKTIAHIASANASLPDNADPVI